MMLFSVVIGVWVSCTEVMNSRRNQKEFAMVFIGFRFLNMRHQQRLYRIS